MKIPSQSSRRFFYSCTSSTNSLLFLLDQVSLPFLIVHGGNDKVTDPAVSKLLFESARSADKIFKLYPEMWHALTYGEFPENTDIVFSDIVSWLDDRVSMRMMSRLESEQKLENDDLPKAVPA